MAKFLRSRRRSPLSLALSGVATITLDQKLQPRRLKPTREALKSDWDAISSDGVRALSRVKRELESA